MKSKTSRPHKKIKYIQILILITILITAFFVGIISMQFYNSSSRYLKQNFEDSIVNSVTQAAEYVNDCFSKVQWITDQIGNDASTLEFLDEYDKMDISQKRNVSENTLPTLLLRSRMMSSNVSSILFFNATGCIQLGQTVVVGKNMYDFEANLLLSLDKTTLIEPVQDKRPNYSSFDELREHFFFVKPIMNSDKKSGYLCVVFDGAISNKLLSAYPNTALCGSEGGLLINNTAYNDADFHSSYEASDSQKVKAALPQKETRFNGLTVFYVQNTQKLEHQTRILISVILVLGIFTLGFAWLFAYFNSKHITKPLQQLIAKIEDCNLQSGMNTKSSSAKSKGLSLREHILYYLLDHSFNSLCLIQSFHKHLFPPND